MNAVIERINARTLKVSGSLDFNTVPQLLADSKALFAAGKNHTLDLAEVTHANSAGLALLLEWKAWATASGQRLVFRDIPPSLLEIAQVSNVSQLLSSKKA